MSFAIRCISCAALAETAGRRQPEVGPFTDDIKAEVDRIDKLIHQLLQYTRPLDLDTCDVAVEELCASVCDRVCRGHERTVVRSLAVLVVAVDGLGSES